MISYTVTARNTSDTTKKTSLELDPGETEFEIKLIEGTYTLSVEGFLTEGDGKKKILRGTYRNAATNNTVTIDKEHPNPQVGKIYVNPFFDEGGTGTVSLKMNLSGCKIKSVKAVWKKQGADGTEKTATFNKGGSVLTEIFFGGSESESEEPAFSFSESESTADIPSGIYEVTFSFYNDATQQDEVHKLFSCTHFLNVYQNLTTGRWKSSTAGTTYIADGKFTLTQEIINRYIRHKFYVDQSKKATSLNEGTWYAPFDSVKTAVEKIRIINDGEPFTVILLSDDTDESAASYTSENKSYIDIAPNTSLPLAVTILGKDGDDNDTLRTINAARDANAGITGRVMYVGSKATVTLNNIGIAGGYSGDSYGGGIYNTGTLTITGNSKISGNTAQSGGGVYVNSGTFTMNGGTISGNATTMHGGAIFVNKNAQATITDGATISGNTAMSSNGGSVYNFGTLEISNVTITGGYSYTGGGIYNTGTLTMTDSTISNCTATGYGAGFFNVGTSASATITNCTISGCTAETTTSYGGGGIYITDGTMSLDGCTIGGDSESDGCTASHGGGISLFGGTLTFTGSTTTIKNCTATTFGGGIYINTNNSAAISNCIIESCKITATSGTVGGGGIYNESGTASDPVTITGCTIRQCTSEARGSGGGIYNKNGVLAISGGEISGCLSKTDGGGIFNTDATLSVNNTTISGCESGSRGGGIFNGSAATAAITDCTVESCSTSTNGGGINNYGGTLTVSGGTVRNCTAEQAWGGGIFSTNVGGGTSVFTATGVTVSKCTAKGGGGIYTTTPSSMIDSCIITGCTATYPDYSSGGGGIYESGDGVTIKNCTIGGSGTGEGNTAAYGGGLYCNRTLTITGGTIIGNTATTNGGGMRIQQNSDNETRITLDGVTITKNTAERYGGGVYNFSNSAGKYPALIMNGGEISQNSSGTKGGGIYNDGRLTVNSGMIFDNTATEKGGDILHCGTEIILAGTTFVKDIYMEVNNYYITAASDLALAAGKTVCATISLDDGEYTADRQVLQAPDGGTITPDICEKFAVAQDPNGIEWKVTPDGTGTKGVLRNSTLYVRGVGVGWYTENPGYTASAASDTNSGSKSAPFATIRKAVETVLAMNDGTSEYTIYVDGTITDSAAGANGMADISPASTLNLKIQSMSETTHATLDAQNNGRVMNIGANAAVTLNNVNITNGNTADNGGGVYNEGSLTIDGGAITNCTVVSSNDMKGGGIYSEAGTLILESGTISGNEAKGGGGGVYVSGGTFEMSGGKISSNTATTDETATPNGGGVCFESGSFTMSGGEISDNTAKGAGGGVYFKGTAFTMSGTAKISGNKVTYASGGHGGGVSLKSGTFTIEDGEISGNTSTGTGGGVYSSDTLIMKGGTVSGNTATTAGGGVYVNSGTFEMSGTAEISRNEATGTGSTNGGGGVAVTASVTFTMTNGTISGNTATVDGGGVKVAGTFTMEGGLITSNTAASGGGVCKASIGTFNANGGTVSGNTPDQVYNMP